MYPPEAYLNLNTLTEEGWKGIASNILGDPVYFGATAGLAAAAYMAPSGLRGFQTRLSDFYASNREARKQLIAANRAKQMPREYFKEGAKRDVKASTNPYQATRMRSKAFRNRKTKGDLTRSKAIQQFFRNRFPIVDLRTYPSSASYSIAASSAMQRVSPATNDDANMEHHVIGHKTFFEILKRKFQRDVMPNDWTDGLFAADNVNMNVNAANEHRMGLTVLNQTRVYKMMNTCSTRAFVEIYEYVWKGPPEAVSTSTDMLETAFHPNYLWSRDMIADDGTNWGTTVSMSSDADIGPSTLGARPNSKCKYLNRYWAIEKKTAYAAGPGEMITHTVNIPGFYLTPAEISPRTGAGVINSCENYIKGKTRFIMMITWGQQGYEGATGAGNNARIDSVPAVFNVRWRQYTKCRIQEAGQKAYFQYTCPHDLTTTTSTRPEHAALTTPSVLLIDAADVVQHTDHDG